MSTQIKFATPSKEYIYTGRNGVGACCGIDVFPILSTVVPAKVILAPINSKGSIANCDMQIPVSAIPELIEALRSIQVEHDLLCKAKG